MQKIITGVVLILLSVFIVLCMSNCNKMNDHKILEKLHDFTRADLGNPVAVSEGGLMHDDPLKFRRIIMPEVGLGLIYFEGNLVYVALWPTGAGLIMRKKDWKTYRANNSIIEFGLVETNKWLEAAIDVGVYVEE